MMYCRGVVQLFNAVSKAQKKASQEGSQPGSKDKASSFLMEPEHLHC